MASPHHHPCPTPGRKKTKRIHTSCFSGAELLFKQVCNWFFLFALEMALTLKSISQHRDAKFTTDLYQASKLFTLFLFALWWHNTCRDLKKKKQPSQNCNHRIFPPSPAFWWTRSVKSRSPHLAANSAELWNAGSLGVNPASFKEIGL